jgi:hypothetical protein
MWDLRWTNWQWDRYFPEHSSLPLSISFHQCPLLGISFIRHRRYTAEKMSLHKTLLCFSLSRIWYSSKPFLQSLLALNTGQKRLSGHTSFKLHTHIYSCIYIYIYIYGRTDGRTDGRMDGRTDGWMDGWIDR